MRHVRKVPGLDGGWTLEEQMVASLFLRAASWTCSIRAAVTIGERATYWYTVRDRLPDEVLNLFGSLECPYSRL